MQQGATRQPVRHILLRAGVLGRAWGRERPEEGKRGGEDAYQEGEGEVEGGERGEKHAEQEQGEGLDEEGLLCGWRREVGEGGSEDGREEKVGDGEEEHDCWEGLWRC